MFERSDERAVRSQSFIPPTELCRERRRYLDFVNRREESYPGKAFGKRSRILGKELRKIRVLKIFQPVRHAEMTEIGNRSDALIVKRVERLVGEVPIVLARTCVR